MMDLDLVFDDISVAMIASANQRSITAIEVAVKKHGLTPQGDHTTSHKTAWEVSDQQGRTLHLEWRWYDQSQAFSMRPDMNILTLELRDQARLARSTEQRYED